jgi:subtilase family serine protease
VNEAAIAGRQRPFDSGLRIPRQFAVPPASGSLATTVRVLGAPSRIPGGGVVSIQKGADPQNRIAESNENNNKVQLTIPMQ